MIEEVWKDVVGYEDYYQVSNIGNVRRKEDSKNSRRHDKKSIVMKAALSKKGYKRLALHVDNKKLSQSVHRLVAIAFIPNPENKKEVNHINGVKTDNSVENLEWVTGKENVNHAIENGLMTFSAISGVNNYGCKISEEAVKDIKLNCIKGVLTKKSFAIKYNVPISTIKNITSGRAWKWLKVE